MAESESGDLENSKRSEGDVELQDIVPLFFGRSGLGFDLFQVKSKKYLARKDIGKGRDQRRGYVPDFCIYDEALPILVIEAKAPNEDARQAFSEAALYALELNKPFESGVNPCQLIFSTNGTRFFAGNWDTDIEIEGMIEDLQPGSELLQNLKNLLGRDAVSRLAKDTSSQLRKHRFQRAGSLGAGPTILDSKIEPNTFAADLTPTLRRYFASRDQNSDPEIYDKAYISSNEVTSYDRILESFLKDRTERLRSTIEIKTTRKSASDVTSSIKQARERRNASGELQLITGSVGAGKSLFARRYKEMLQPEDLMEVTHWAFIDFNDTPFLDASSQSWLCEQFVHSLQREGAPVDLRDADDQERVFASDLSDRKSYYERRERLTTGAGELEKARDLELWRQEPIRAARGCARYLQGDRGETLVVVFDNVDRRDTKEQLIAFQLALWFMNETRALVLLQMRDATFEAHKGEPPLDTYKTGQVFHVSPPRFVDVVRRRLELSLEAFGPDSTGNVSYKTSNGVTITYPKARAGDYLRQIYHEVFQRPKNISVILESLAAKNVRKSLDMFMALITSGHMPEDMISAISRGQVYNSLPEWVMLRVLMRQDYRFFSEKSGFISNVFDCDIGAARPSNFLRVEILYFLISARKRLGENGLLGFVAWTHLRSRLEFMGFVASDVDAAILKLLQQGLLESDNLSGTNSIALSSVRATASAWAHMRLLPSRIEYISSILPTTPIADPGMIAKVVSALTDEARIGHLSLARQRSLVTDFEDYLRREYERHRLHSGFAATPRTGAAYVIEKVSEARTFAVSGTRPGGKQLDLLDV